MWSYRSVIPGTTSTRKPMFAVSLGLIFQSSCAYIAKVDHFQSELLGVEKFALFTAPSIRLA